MEGSMAWARRSWSHGRGPGSLKQEMKRSIKANKRVLNRKVRRIGNIPNGCAYKKFAGCMAYDLVS